LSELPAQYRLVIILRYWHDYSYEEIAEITNSTESAVKSRLHRARRMMAAMMEEPNESETAQHKAQWRESENAMSACL
ncbi:MAG: sigma-70 region 4 domain-containing protein, partial [Chloroflexi bacterium]|nr:sigma-70 region 4 domain-containing protein [Chloroflexota bacterium]